MSKIAKPWFNHERGWWMTWLGGRKLKLAPGRKNKKAAQDRLEELKVQARLNPAPGADQTVASVIETYQSYSNSRLAGSTVAVRSPYLQSFAEAHGFRPIRECTPLHMEQWLDEHPQWKSDWTKNGAVRNVQVAFNWAVKKRVIQANPFQGVTHRAGPPRRAMTHQEFRSILRACRSKGRKRPTPASRFRKVLIFVWLTGCRPGEAAKLRWKHVDLEHGVAVLPEHKTIRTQKEPKPRVLPLHPRVVRLLKQLRREGEHVFLTHRKTVWNKNTLAQRVKRARRFAPAPTRQRSRCAKSRRRFAQLRPAPACRRAN
jgi:integrase/recombinase XerC